MSTLADQLFALFEEGHFKAAIALFAVDAEIRQHYAPYNGKPISIADFEASLSGIVKAVGSPKYLNRRVATFDGGFVEQHTSQLGTALLEVCVVVRTNADGKISVLEEYLDPSPLARHGQTKTVKTSSEAGKVKTGQAEAKVEQPEDNLGPAACCIVTGASSGIGEQIAIEYAKRGCAVVLAGRRGNLLDEVAERCRAQHPSCRTLAVPTDVSSPAECTALVEQTVAAFGPPARLVLNAGISQNAELSDSGPGLVREQMEVNFFGAANTAIAALPHMLALQESGGCPGVLPRIMVVSSALGLLSAPKNTGYCASKAALHGFFDSLRSELGDRLGVSMIAPGAVNTPILRSLSGPRGTRVAMELDDKTLAGMVTAEEAGKMAVRACEAGDWTYVFPPLDALVQMRAQKPRKVEAIVRAMYAGEKGIKTRTLPDAASKL